MIDFSLSDEHRLLEQSIREWGAQNVAPFIRENDRQHHFDRDRILGGTAAAWLKPTADRQHARTARDPAAYTDHPTHG